jgi:hypothetical protein
MDFLVGDQNQGTRASSAAERSAVGQHPSPGQSFPLSFIRTLTVGFGIAPNLLTLPALSSGQALAGFDGPKGPRYRRWGLSPRPENVTANSGGAMIMAKNRRRNNFPVISKIAHPYGTKCMRQRTTAGADST